MVKTYLLILCSYAPCLSAQERPGLQQWISQLGDEVWLKTPGLIRNFAFQASSGSSQQQWDKILAADMDCSFLQYMDSAAARYARTLNPHKPVDSFADPMPGSQLPVQLLLREEAPSISAAANVGSRTLKLGNWTIPPAAMDDALAFHQWLSGKLGSDAIVLAVRDGWILAGLLKNSVEAGQGLLLHRSQNLWLVPEQKGPGAALLQIGEVKNCFATLQVLLESEEAIVPGAKIIFGLDDSR